MEILDVMVLNVKERKMNDEIHLKKIKDVKFCWICGTRELNSNDVCGICSNTTFLDGDIAEMIAGYFELDNQRLLKKYYDKVTGRKFSGVNMNSKRVVFQLLVRDNLVDYKDREMERLIQKIMWKRF